MTAVIFLIILAILVLAHEFGHFIAAKHAGVAVEEFGFGFPPRLFGKKIGETLYSVNAIPFGGFVKMLGEDSENAGDPASFSAKTPSRKAVILSAGVAFNIILAWFLISVNLTLGMPVNTALVPSAAEEATRQISIIEVAPRSPADDAGLKIGDRIIGFARVKEVQDFIAGHKGENVEITYGRGGEVYSVKILSRENPPEGEGAIGIAMNETTILKLPWYKSFFYAVKVTALFTYAIASGIAVFIFDALRGAGSFGQVMGPVGIVSATGSFAKMGLPFLINFTAFLSINLAILNIIPFPALDGGRLLFLAIEKIKRSPIKVKTASVIHTAGFFILIALMLAITYKDILRLF